MKMTNSMRQIVRVIASSVPCSYETAWKVYMDNKQKRGLTVYK